MPLAVKCSSCHARLGVPDQAAGTKVKCPRCAAMVPVPGGEQEFEVVEDDFEVVEDEPKKPSKAGVIKSEPLKNRPRRLNEDHDPPPRKPTKRPQFIEDDDEYDDRPRRRPIEDDEDYDDRPRRRFAEDDEDDDDRPRRRKFKASRRQPASSNLMLILAGVGGLLLVLLLGAGGYMYYLGKKRESALSGSGIGGGSGEWVTFSPPDGSFTVSLPKSPLYSDVLAVAKLMGLSEQKTRDSLNELRQQGLEVLCWKSEVGKRHYFVAVIHMPVDVTAQVLQMMRNEARDSLRQELSIAGTILGEETMTVAGQPAIVIRGKLKNGKQVISGSVVTRRIVFELRVIDNGELALTDPDFRKFINSLTVNAMGAGPGAGLAPAGPGVIRRPDR